MRGEVAGERHGYFFPTLTAQVAPQRLHSAMM